MSHEHKDTEMEWPTGMYGAAFSRVLEREDGTLWIDNGEYQSQVSFCPVCGYKAKVPMPANPG